MELPSSFSGSIRFDLFHVDLPARLFFKLSPPRCPKKKEDGGFEAFSDDLIRNHPRENSRLCVLSGVIFALCYFRVAHIYIDQKIFLKNPQDVLSSATRKWSCLLNNCHRTETRPAPSQCSTPTLDEWSAFAAFLADVIEKYASVLEIDNAISSTNNENQQDTVDTVLAA